jgi:hypothetical protein
MPLYNSKLRHSHKNAFNKMPSIIRHAVVIHLALLWQCSLRRRRGLVGTGEGDKVTTTVAGAK